MTGGEQTERAQELTTKYAPTRVRRMENDDYVWSDWASQSHGGTGGWYDLRENAWQVWTGSSTVKVTSARSINVYNTYSNNIRVSNPQIETWGQWVTNPRVVYSSNLADNTIVEAGWTTVAQAAWRVGEGFQRTAEQARAAADRLQEAREAESRHRLERQRRYEQEAAQRAQAHDRGMELLEIVLTSEEKLWRDNQGDGTKIMVRGSEGGMYVIDTAYYGNRGSVHGNVHKTDEHGCFLGRVCVAPDMRLGGETLPLSDGYVGQLLAIKHNENHFIETGNWSGVRECAHQDVPVLRVA